MSDGTETTSEVAELRDTAKIVLSKPTIANRFDNAANWLAQSVLDITDDTLVDETFAADNAIRTNGSCYYILAENDDTHLYVVLIRWSGGWHLKVGDASIALQATRGHVRRVLLAVR